MSGTLYLEKISRYDRPAEPVSVSIPLARGRLEDPAGLTIRDDQGRALPVQRHVLATWDDGSVKWMQVHLQPDLPGNSDATLTLDVGQATGDPQPERVVTITEREGAIDVDTGPLRFTVAADAFWPVRDLVLDGQPLFGAQPFGGFALSLGGEALSTAGAAVALEVLEAGPLRVVIEARGKHRRADGTGYIDLRGRVTAYAGKPYIEIEHQFVHAEEAGELALESLEVAFRPKVSGQPHVALGQGYYQTGIEESDESVEMLLDAETMLYQSNEHFVDCFYGDFWADWRDARGGLAISIHQAHQNFPKALRADREGIVCSLYPQSVDPAPTMRGMGKTHRILLHVHGPDTPLNDISVRSLQFQLPDVPSLPRAWYRENNPWVETFFPEQLPQRLLHYFLQMHDGRPKVLGMYHFGDAPDAGYTDQGRGRGKTVWVNNEYDRPHQCAILYGLTGERRVLDSGLVAARHWMDVDLCHHDPDPLVNGGLKIHTRYHVTGGVTPSHEWTEGFLDYYFFTGRREALEAACSVGENIMRHMALPRMQRPGEASVREGGWAMRAMIGLYLGTGEERWRKEAERLAELYLSWYEEYGALLAPYTSHSMPRVVFMISLTVNSFARYLLIDDNPRVKQLIVDNVDDMLAHCLGPDGIPYYKELPSLRRPAPTPHLLEALAHAYRITGEDRYLKVASRVFAALERGDATARQTAKFVDDSGAVIAGHGGGRIFASTFPSVLLYASEAAPAGLLDWYEYPY
ncbi:MAG: hypothetical protein GX649_15420 [Chloroflexi bacterium]|nr:hypothetical protein [Chloroflexota bacterium]